MGLSISASKCFKSLAVIRNLMMNVGEIHHSSILNRCVSILDDEL